MSCFVGVYRFVTFEADCWYKDDGSPLPLPQTVTLFFTVRMRLG